MRGETTFRRARQEDLPAIVRMLADDTLGSRREKATDPLPASYVDAFAAIDADPRMELVVGERQGTVVGTLQLMFLPHLSEQGGLRAQIESVRVHSSVRRLGIGEAMMRWAIDRAAERGCVVVQLTTNRTRAEAQRFYQRLGFVDSHVGMKYPLVTPSRLDSAGRS